MGNLDVVWMFLTGNFLGNLIFFFLIIGGLLLCTLIFQAACALADVEPAPSFLYSLLLVLITLALLVPINAALAYLCIGSAIHETLGGWGLAAILVIVGFILCVAISSALHILALRISVTKGLLTGLFEQLLALLAFSLLYGVLLVILALVQLINKPMNNKTALVPPPRSQASLPRGLRLARVPAIVAASPS